MLPESSRISRMLGRAWIVGLPDPTNSSMSSATADVPEARAHSAPAAKARSLFFTRFMASPRKSVAGCRAESARGSQNDPCRALGGEAVEHHSAYNSARPLPQLSDRGLEVRERHRFAAAERVLGVRVDLDVDSRAGGARADAQSARRARR